MSAESSFVSPVEVAQLLYPALATGDRAALDALLAPEFVGVTTPGLPLGLGGRYEGAAAMRRDFWGAIGRSFDVRAEPRAFDDLGDGRVLVSGTYVGSARETKRPFEADFVHVLTTADGWITGLTQLTDSEAWCDALRHKLTTLTLTVTVGLAHLHLRRPEVANAIDVAMARDLRTAVETIARDATVRAVLITGEGNRFCAGGDIGLFSGTDQAELPALLDLMITDYHVALRTLTELAVPVVCGVQGAAAGGGLGLVYAADVVVTEEDAKFAVGYSAIGLGADGGSTWYLPRLVGPAVAAQMLYENRVLTGVEAQALGLATEVVPAAAVQSRATEIATRLATGPTKALGVLRTLVRGTWDRSLAQQLDDERASIVAVAATHDAYEGLHAFAARRLPDFHGK